MSKGQLSVGVVGAAGYAGGEMCRLLLNHPAVGRIVPSASRVDEFERVHPNLTGCGLVLSDHEALLGSAQDHDVIFFCTPTGTAMKYAGGILAAGTAVVDLSADFRFPNTDVFEAAHGEKHADPTTQLLAVPGLTEYRRADLRAARLVANPGCYVTAVVLGVAPLIEAGVVDVDGRITINAQNGTTGAGSTLRRDLMHSEVFGSILPYNLDGHRHAPEIGMHLEQFAAGPLRIDFATSHGAFARGIYAVVSAQLAPSCTDITREHLLEILVNRYGRGHHGEYFVSVNERSRALGVGAKEYAIYPSLVNVVGSNFVQIGADVDHRASVVRVVVVMDNLVKGAAGSAIQNFNVLAGLEETCGLRQYGL